MYYLSVIFTLIKLKKMAYTYKYPRPAVTVDCVIFGYDATDLKILLIERGIEPFKGRYALPGGFVRMNETTDMTAERELREETGLDRIYLEQLYTFSELDRDPRGRVVSVAYYALINLNDYKITAGDDAKDADWYSINKMPDLAFDHQIIFVTALNRLKGKIRYQPIGFELLPAKFTLTELQRLYEAILNISIDKRNFRKKILKMNLLEKLNEKETNVARKAAYYYKFKKEQYKELSKAGFNFEI